MWIGFFVQEMKWEYYKRRRIKVHIISTVGEEEKINKQYDIKNI